MFSFPRSLSPNRSSGADGAQTAVSFPRPPLLVSGKLFFRPFVIGSIRQSLAQYFLCKRSLFRRSRLAPLGIKAVAQGIAFRFQFFFQRIQTGTENLVIQQHGTLSGQQTPALIQRQFFIFNRL